MKIWLLILLLGISANAQVVDSTAIYTGASSYAKEIHDYQTLIDSLIKSKSEKDIQLVNLQKRTAPFFGIASLLITYSFADALKLTQMDKNAIRDLMIDVSNEMFKKGNFVHISIDEDEFFIRKIWRQIPSKNTQVTIALVGYTKSKYINAQKVEPLLKSFNENILKKLEQ